MSSPKYCLGGPNTRPTKPQNSVFELVDELIEDLKTHESVVYEIYTDLPKNAIIIVGASFTCLGVSHRIEPSEKYYGKPIGTHVSEEDVEFYLRQDAQNAVENSKQLFQNFQNIPKTAQLVLSYMMWIRNTGYER